MDKIVLPGPYGEAEGALTQCAVCCHRGLSTPRVRERSVEHSAYEVLDKLKSRPYRWKHLCVLQSQTESSVSDYRGA